MRPFDGINRSRHPEKKLVRSKGSHTQGLEIRRMSEMVVTERRVHVLASASGLALLWLTITLKHDRNLEI